MPLDDDTQRRLALLLQRDANPSGYDETGQPMPAERSGMASLLMALRDKVPENPSTGFSGLNMLRGALERSANLQDVVGGYRDPKTADPLDLVPMLAPGAIAGAMRGPSRNTLMSAGGVPPKEPPGFTAYHGSPHDFDRFSMDKIGSGEGAQAYGHGLYFADAEGVARSYRDTLADRSARTVTKDYGADDIARMAAVESDATRRANLQDVLAEMKAGATFADVVKRSPEPPMRYTFGDDLFKTPGHMYEVRIKADPNDFLDWDKPLSAQSATTRAALERLTRERGIPVSGKAPNGVDWELGASNIYDRLATSQGGVGASRDIATTTLRDAGIPGIRYDDAMSRGGPGGTRNTVVFDDRLIEIIRKYGLAAALLGGGAAAMGGPSSPAVASE